MTCDQVGTADELGDEAIRWGVEQFSRATYLLQNARIEHRHAVSGSHRFFLIVSHEDRCDAERALQPF